MTGLRIGVAAHHSTTTAATSANTPYAMAGSRLVARAHAPDGRRRPRSYSRLDAGVHFPSDVLVGALVATSAAQSGSTRSSGESPGELDLELTAVGSDLQLNLQLNPVGDAHLKRDAVALELDAVMARKTEHLPPAYRARAGCTPIRHTYRTCPAAGDPPRLGGRPARSPDERSSA